MENMVNKEFWKNKKVLITGHTGFKGSWLTTWLDEMNCTWVGISLKPDNSNYLFNNLNFKESKSCFFNINDRDKLISTITNFEPDIIFHLAAQPLVNISYLNPLETYDTNVIGTLNILEAMRLLPNKVVGIMITTDKCYKNLESANGYKESDPLGGWDPYSSSKACCEILIESYRNSFFSKNEKKLVASVRAGNVIGGGDRTIGRLIPDLIHALLNKSTLTIRNLHAVRPWQHVLEPLYGYLLLAQRLYEGEADYADAWNFGPDLIDCKSVEWIINEIHKISGLKLKLNSQQQHEIFHETTVLKLNTEKAQKLLNWYPSWDIEQTLRKIIEWEIDNQELNFRNRLTKQIREYGKTYE